MHQEEVANLRKRLGLKDGQLLTNADGEIADILDCDEETVTLGILTRSTPIKIPLSCLKLKED